MLGIRALAAFVLALYVPVLLFVLGPIALGVPHVAADLRYLLLRRRFAPWWALTIAGACLSLLASQVLEQVGEIRSSESARLGKTF